MEPRLTPDNYLLNEEAIREMGLKDPIGKPFSLYNVKGIIAGIVQDFHFKDIHQKIGPCVIFWKPQYIGQIYVGTTAGHTPDAIAAVQKIWKTYNSEYPFEYSFLDNVYNKMYATDQQTGSLFKVFAFIAIFISCLGLFGLVTYTAQLKTREIGIRKVLGATVSIRDRPVSRRFYQPCSSGNFNCFSCRLVFYGPLAPGFCLPHPDPLVDISGRRIICFVNSRIDH